MGRRGLLCGAGELIRIGAPSVLFASAEKLNLAPPSPCDRKAEGGETFQYSCRREDRWLRYVELIKRSGNFIILFPEQGLAREFWDNLPGEVREVALLWPSQGGKRQLAAWMAARNGEVRGVVGGPGALFAPLGRVDAIIVDEESSGSYRSYARPRVNVRTLAGKRARLESANLLLSGRVPSSRAFLHGKPRSTDRPDRSRLRFVDVKEAFDASIRGLSDTLPLTSALLTGTESCLASGRVALWLLDRKGFAGEIACEECGGSVRCGECGASVVREEQRDRTRCPSCGSLAPMPEECPECRGRLLCGKRPGLEAVHSVAKSLANRKQPALLLDELKSAGKRKLKEISDLLSSGGIALGTRAALSLCDLLEIGFVAWLDVDAEARSTAYQARFTAFSMVWESIWRGRGAGERTVLLQSRRPGVGWQRGIALGWDVFWRQELSERRELGLPPFSCLVEIRARGESQKSELLASMGEAGLAPMDPGDPPLVLWVASSSVSAVRRALEPFFSIRRSRGGFPEIIVWTD